MRSLYHLNSDASPLLLKFLIDPIFQTVQFRFNLLKFEYIYIYMHIDSRLYFSNNPRIFFSDIDIFLLFRKFGRKQIC